MKNMVRQVPIPIAGVVLGLTALGNLLQGYSETARLWCGGIAAFLGVFLLLKFLFHPDQIKRDCENPILASVSATIFMAVMQLSTYAYPYVGRAAFWVWMAAVAGHGLLIGWYTKKFLFRFRIEEVFPTCFVTYVGIVVASVTSGTFGMEALGRGIFWFGFSAYIVMFGLITYRYARVEVPEAAKPLFCIYTAPMSLSLAGYLTVADEKSFVFTLVLEILAQVLYLVVLTQLPKFLRLPFYPSYAAFTFPFVITAFALQKWIAYLGEISVEVPVAAEWILAAETVIAAVLVMYTVFHFILYLLGHMMAGSDRKRRMGYL